MRYFRIAVMLLVVLSLGFSDAALAGNRSNKKRNSGHSRTQRRRKTKNRRRRKVGHTGKVHNIGHNTEKPTGTKRMQRDSLESRHLAAKQQLENGTAPAINASYMPAALKKTPSDKKPANAIESVWKLDP